MKAPKAGAFVTCFVMCVASLSSLTECQAICNIARIVAHMQGKPKMKKPMVKRVPTKGIHVTTIRLDDATLAALDKHAKGAADGPRPRAWLIQKIIAEWLKAQSDKVNLLGHTQGISE